MGLATLMDGNNPVAPRPLVLVVDDDETVNLALQHALGRLGYDVIVAESGADAFERALIAQPAVVLADVHMPGTDGHELLRRLTLSGVQSSVVLMSGRGELDDAISALREGAIDYLKKPWTMDELSASLDRAMQLFRAIHSLSVPSVAASADPVFSGNAQLQARVTREGSSPAHRAVDGPSVAVDAAGFVEGLSGEMSAAGLDLEAPGFTVTQLKAYAECDVPDRSAVLMLSVSLRQLFPLGHTSLRVLNDRIWRFSVSRAMAMSSIAHLAQIEVPIAPPRCFVAGLLLDLGASYLVSRISEWMGPTSPLVSDPTSMIAAIASHHGRIGSLILRQWTFPDELALLVESHHQRTAIPLAPLSCAAALGGAIAVRLAGFGDPTGDGVMKPEFLAHCAYKLGVGDTSLRRLTARLQHDTSEVWAASS